MAVAIAVPSILYASARLAAGLHGIYVAEGLPTRFLGIPRAILEPVRFGLTTFFPIETETLKDVVTGSVTGVASSLAVGRGLVAVALNLLGWLLVLRLLQESTERARLWPLLFMGIMVVPMVKAEPRIMYFSQALLLPLFVYAATRWWALRTSKGHPLPKWFAPVAISSMLLVGPSYYITQQAIVQPDLVAHNRATTLFQDTMLAAISDPDVHRLYLVNATSSMSPGLSLLRYLAAVGGRPDIRLRVVNTFGGEIPSDDGHGAVEFVKHGDDLEGIITIGPSQQLFGGLSPDRARLLGEEGMIEYGPFIEFEVDELGHWNYTGRELSFRVPNASRDDFAIIGLDPGREGVFILKLPSTSWTRISQLGQAL